MNDKEAFNLLKNNSITIKSQKNYATTKKNRLRVGNIEENSSIMDEKHRHGFM